MAGWSDKVWHGSAKRDTLVELHKSEVDVAKRRITELEWNERVKVDTRVKSLIL